MQYVIVGAGPAGVTAADQLRTLDPTARIMVISEEPDPPYARMALPYLLCGNVAEKGIRLRQREDHFRQANIELRHGKVAGIEPADRRIVLAGGQAEPYDRLLLATGSRPWSPQIEGLEQPAVGHCWTLSDARAIIALAKEGSHVALLGAGFVACIILDALIARGCRVTVITGPSGRLVRNMLCPAGSDLLQAWCEQRGVTFVKGEQLSAIEPGPVVTLQSGHQIPVEVAIIATGVEANADIARECGLRVDRGIVVDDAMQTATAGIYAAGDVAQSKRFGSGELEVHAIHPAAVEHGRYAAHNMAGRRAAYHGSLPMNFLEALGLACTSYGAWRDEPHQQLVERTDSAAFRFLRLTFHDNRLVGANAIGIERHVGSLRGLIQSQCPLGRWQERLTCDPFRFPEAFIACCI